MPPVPTVAEVVEPGPTPVLRAAIGLVLGAVLGVVSVLLTPREDD